MLFRFVMPLLVAAPVVCGAQSFRVYKGDTINVTDKKGLKQGVWKRYYETDTLFTITTYRNGKPVGTTLTYYPDGKRKAEVVHGAGGRSVMTGYHPNDSVMVKGLYRSMQKDSVWLFFDEEGLLTATETYASGKKTGTWKVYYPGKGVSEETTWKNDRREGPYRQYFEDGKKKFEATYRNDTFEGPCTMFHPNGKIWFTGTYTEGLQEGTWIFNNENGVRDSVRQFRHGLPSDGK